MCVLTCCRRFDRLSATPVQQECPEEAPKPGSALTACRPWSESRETAGSYSPPRSHGLSGSERGSMSAFNTERLNDDRVVVSKQRPRILLISLSLWNPNKHTFHKTPERKTEVLRAPLVMQRLGGEALRKEMVLGEPPGRWPHGPLLTPWTPLPTSSALSLGSEQTSSLNSSDWRPILSSPLVPPGPAWPTIVAVIWPLPLTVQHESSGLISLPSSMIWQFRVQVIKVERNKSSGLGVRNFANHLFKKVS